MNRTMTMSALAAAAIHGGMLLGWPRGEAPSRSPEEAPAICIYPLPPRVDDEPVLVVPTDPADLAPRKGPPRPTSAEQITVGPAVFPIPILPVPAADPGPMKTIPFEPPGVENGVDDIKGRGIFSPIDLDSSPRTRAQPAPIYPFEKRRTGEAGEVTVEFSVDESGRVTEPRVTHASDRAFEAAALQAIVKWRFEPGRRLGRVVRFRMVQTFTFKLNEG